jgi:hypothetical protein
MAGNNKRSRIRDDDIGDVITYPRTFIVTGHALIEGGASDSAPSFIIEAKDTKPGAGPPTTGASINNLITMSIKDGVYNVSVRDVPAGYQLKSITYGTTDLQKAPLKIDGPSTWEIIVRLVPAPR